MAYILHIGMCSCIYHGIVLNTVNLKGKRRKILPGSAAVIKMTDRLFELFFFSLTSHNSNVNYFENVLKERPKSTTTRGLSSDWFSDWCSRLFIAVFFMIFLTVSASLRVFVTASSVSTFLCILKQLSSQEKSFFYRF